MLYPIERNEQIMKTNRHSRGALTLAAVGAFAIALGGAIPAAYAAEGNIDPAKSRTLTIHKQEAGTQTATGTPDGATVTGGTPIAGVEFTAYPITNVDLTTAAGWDLLDGVMVPTDACAVPGEPALTLSGAKPATFGTAIVSAKTGVDGTTTIPNPALAAYLLCETDAPPNVNFTSAPFVVTVPTPMAGSDWIYEVNVYPKNVLTQGVAKYVDQAAALQVGDQLTYVVEKWIPTIDASQYFKHFVIEEPIPTGLTAISNWATVSLVDSHGSPVTLVETTDYVLNDTTTQDTLWVGFTADGLAKLRANQAGTVTVEFTFSVVVPAAGQITNTANLYMALDTTAPTNPPIDNPGGTPEPSQQAITYVGDYRFTKVDAENSAALSGATFKVYAATLETQWPDAGSCAEAVKTGSPISFTIAGSSVTELTSDANGVVHVPSLFIDTMSSMDGTLPVSDQRCYVLVETAAPIGYTLPTNADFPILVNAGVTTTPLDPSITNTRTAVPAIPLTGAVGQALLIAGGVALILVAAGFAVASYRRNRSLKS